MKKNKAKAKAPSEANLYYPANRKRTIQRTLKTK